MSVDERELETVTAEDVGSVESVLGDTLEPSIEGETLADDPLATPEIDVPAAEPEAHRGEIVSVEMNTAGTGSVSFRVNLRSIDNGREDKLDVWLPRGFVENINVDPKTLPEDKLNGGMQQTSYRIGVANSGKKDSKTGKKIGRGDATIQKLRYLAMKLGRRYTGPPAETIGDFIAAHNEMMSGLAGIVYVKRPEQIKEDDDPRFAGQLRVKDIIDENEAFDPRNRNLKGVRKMWEL